MTTLELLRQTAGELASQLDKAEDEQLPRITSAIAHSVVEIAGLSHPVITEALHHLGTSARPHPELCERVQSLADQLDEGYFDLNQQYEGRAHAGKTDSEVAAAFAKARAANAVAAALGSDVRSAVTETAYEAVSCIDDSGYFTGVVRSIITK